SKRKADGQRGPNAIAGGKLDQPGENQAGDRHLEQAEPQYVVAQAPEAARLQLETDQEKQQHDTDVRDLQDIIGIGDEAQAERANQSAGAEVAEHRTQTQAAEQSDEQQGCAQQDDAVAQQHAGGGDVRSLHQAAASAASAAASAMASKASRIERCRTL